MNSQTSGYLVLFGVVLILFGIMTYMTHPAKAQAALIAGAGSGILWILWGILSARGVRWSWLAALATTGLVGLVFLWRASLNWLAVADGQSERAFVSLIISLMLALSVLMLVFLFQDRRIGGAGKPEGGAA